MVRAVDGRDSHSRAGIWRISVHENNNCLRLIGRGLKMVGLLVSAAACGVIPRGNDAVDQKWYVSHCLPHTPKLGGARVLRGLKI